MKFVAANSDEKYAIEKVLQSIRDTFSALPTWIGDFIQPENVDEYIFMLHFNEFDVVIDENEQPMVKTCSTTAEDYYID